MSTPHPLYWDACKLLESAELADDEGSQRNLLDDAISKLSKLIGDHPDNSQYQHLAGLCWYHYPSDDVTRTVKATLHFSKALEIDPAHQFANIYLGYLEFDNGNYNKALNYFERVQSDYFLSLDQQWRILKNNELKICCRLYIDVNSVSTEEIANLVEDYLATDETEAARPDEITQCLTSLLPSSDPKLNEMVHHVVELVEKLDYTQSLSAEYKALKSSLNREA